MDPTLCSHFGLDEWKLRRTGALDIPLVGSEAPVYLDPRLLRMTQVPELLGAMTDVGYHFAAVLTDLEQARAAQGKRRALLLERAKAGLRFPELKGLRIGYGKAGGNGRGIGAKRSSSVYNLAMEIVEDGFQDPELLEMLTIVEKGVGADLISDMIASICRHRLYAFSERVARECSLPTGELKTDIRPYAMPWNPLLDEPIVLPPHDSVADIPAFNRSSSFDSFTFNHESLRKAFSDWVKAHSRAEVRRFLKEHREYVPVALAAYRAVLPAEHDAFKGPQGPALASKEIYEAIKTEILSRTSPPASARELYLTTVELCHRFKAHVESGASRRHLHGDSKPRDEKFVQAMFRLLADSFCQDRDIKLSPESDSGVGPVDFQLDRGASAVSVVELKLSNNKSLTHGYEFQVGMYKRANGAHSAIYCVVDLTGELKALNHLVNLHDKDPEDHNRPFLVIIDGRKTPSASKTKEPLTPLPKPKTQPEPASVKL